MRTIDEAAGAVPAREHESTRAEARGRIEPLTWVAIAVIAFGVLLRLVRFLADRSLWLDEAYLAINLMTRSYGGLLETLDYNQGAPVGFLWTERLSLELLGDSERALRLFPLLVGIAALVLFALVAREVLDRIGFLVGVALFATMEPFVRYSAEVKQYGLDVAVGLALVYLFLRVLERGEPSTPKTALLAVAGPVAVWFSHPSAFVLVGVAAAGLYVALRKGDSRAVVHQLAAYGVWLVSFLVAYFVAIRDLDDLRGTVQGVGAGAGGRIKNLYTLFNEPGSFPRTAVGLAATIALLGLLYLWLRRPGIVVLLAGTTTSLLAAGYLGLYPVGQRFLVFLVAPALLCFAAGVAAVVGHVPRLVAAAILGAVVVLIVLPVVGTAAKRLVAPPKLEESEPLLAEVASSWQPGDVLYLSQYSQYAFRYYAECDDCSETTAAVRRLWPIQPTSGGQPQSTPAIVSRSAALVVGETWELEADRLAGKRRVWLLYTHFYPRTEAELLAEADRSGRRTRCTHGGASLLCLYDFARPPG